MPVFGQGIGSELGLPFWMAAGTLGLLVLVAAVLLYGRTLHTMLWRAGLVTLAALVAWAAADALTAPDRTAQRRAFEARSAELQARTLVPGSPLGCLDGVGSPALEAGCQRTLYANPETLASALAYVDARLTLLADALPLAARDPVFAATLERSRRALEADPYGLVAQVLETRGCTVAQCPAFALLRDPRKVAANLGERTFDAQVALHGRAWTAEGPALASAPVQAPASATPLSPSASPLLALTTPGSPAALQPAVPVPANSSPVPPAASPPTSRYEFPSSDSIPAVSIMEPEPARPAATVSQPSAPSAGQRAPAQRRQSAQRPAPAPQPSAGEPTSIVPAQPPATIGQSQR